MYKLFIILMLTIGLTASEVDFDRLMGKNTSHWKNAEQEDLELLYVYKHNYEQQGLTKARSGSDAKIPRTVHFIWLGPKPFPPQSVENVRTWIAKNPGWTFKFWTDQDRSPPCNGMQRCFVQNFLFQVLGKRYAASQNYGERSDILRYEILFQEGGVYVDHDANCLQPFEELNTAYDFYCGLEAPHPLMAGHRITCGNGVIGSRAGHPVVHRVLELIDERWDGLAAYFCGNDRYSKEELVLRRTYIALTNALKGNLNQYGNVDMVLPAAHFFAKSGMTPLYSKHFFANAWAENDLKPAWEKDVEKELGRINRRTQQLNFYFAASLVLAGAAVALLWILLLKRRRA